MEVKYCSYFRKNPRDNNWIYFLIVLYLCLFLDETFELSNFASHLAKDKMIQLQLFVQMKYV